MESGELLAGETDKATMEFESFQDGVLLHIGVEKGGTAPWTACSASWGKKGRTLPSCSRLPTRLKRRSKEAPEPAPAPAPAPAPWRLQLPPAPAPGPAALRLLGRRRRPLPW